MKLLSKDFEPMADSSLAEAVENFHKMQRAEAARIILFLESGHSYDTAMTRVYQFCFVVHVMALILPVFAVLLFIVNKWYFSDISVISYISIVMVLPTVFVVYEYIFANMRGNKLRKNGDKRFLASEETLPGDDLATIEAEEDDEDDEPDYWPFDSLKDYQAVLVPNRK